ncbi:MAG: hypothetical protein WA871_09315 [Candidatus Acidiferrales bacterium]
MCPRISLAFLATVAALAACAPARAQTDPASLPAHDSHQHLLIAVRPWLDAAEYKDHFGKKNPYDAGIVALDVYFRNDNDSPIKVDLSTVRLVITRDGGDPQSIEDLTPEDVADRVLLNGPASAPAARPRLPIGNPKGDHDKQWTALADSLRAASLSSDLIPPHGTVHGCLYFDLSHHFDLLHDSHLYVPDLTFLVNNQVLLFFEVDLAPAAKL